MAPFCCRILGVVNQNIMRVRFCRKSIVADRGAHIPGVTERTTRVLLYLPMLLLLLERSVDGSGRGCGDGGGRLPVCGGLLNHDSDW